jgi:hypothetical protein
VHDPISPHLYLTVITYSSTPKCSSIPLSMDNQVSRSRNKLIILGEHGVNRDVYAMNGQAVRARVRVSVMKLAPGSGFGIRILRALKLKQSRPSAVT